MNPKGNPLEFLNQILVNYLVLWSDYVRPRVRYTKKFEIPWKLFLLNIWLLLSWSRRGDFVGPSGGATHTKGQTIWEFGLKYKYWLCQTKVNLHPDGRNPLDIYKYIKYWLFILVINLYLSLELNLVLIENLIYHIIVVCIINTYWISWYGYLLSPISNTSWYVLNICNYWNI